MRLAREMIFGVELDDDRPAVGDIIPLHDLRDLRVQAFSALLTEIVACLTTGGVVGLDAAS